MIRVILPISHVPSDYFSRLGFCIPDHVKVSVAKRQHEYMTGRLCAFRAICELGNHYTRIVNCDKNQLPIWPSGIVGSISHSDYYAVAIVGSNIRYASMGVDIEHMNFDRHTIESINDQVIDSEEHRILDEIDTYNKKYDKHLRLTIFSAKESFYKCMYPKIKKHIEFKSIHVIEINQVENFMRLCYGDKTNPLINDLKVNYVYADEISSILTYTHTKAL